MKKTLIFIAIQICTVIFAGCKHPTVNLVRVEKISNPVSAYDSKAVNLRLFKVFLSFEPDTTDLKMFAEIVGNASAGNYDKARAINDEFYAKNLSKDKSYNFYVSVKSLLAQYQKLSVEDKGRSDGKRQVKLIVKSGLPFVEATLKGRVYLFLVDTGSDFCAVSKSIADESDLELEDPEAVPANDFYMLSREIRTGQIDGLGFAGYTFNGVECAVVDDKRFAGYGLIGRNILSRLDFTLDFGHETAEFVLSKDSVISDKANLFCLPAPVLVQKAGDNNYTLSLFDTGNNSFDVSEFFAKSLMKSPDTGSVNRRHWSLNSDTLYRAKELDSICIRLCDWNLTMKNVEVLPDGIFRGLDMNIGSAIWKGGKVRCNSRKGIVEIAPAEMPNCN